MLWRENLSDYVGDAMELVHQTYEGTSALLSMPRVVAALSKVDRRGVDTDQHQEEKDTADKSAAYAAKAQASDFALLHAHTVMGLWGALEAAVEDLASTWLENHPALLSRPKFMRIRVPVAIYETLTPAARFRLIISELQRDLGNDQSFGVGQFEKILTEVELTGAVPPRVRRLLLRAQQYRHLVAHRAGRADSRFLEICPDLGYTLGDPVNLSRTQMNEIFMAMIAYMEELENRVRLARAEPILASDGLAEWLAEEW